MLTVKHNWIGTHVNDSTGLLNEMPPETINDKQSIRTESL